VLRQLFRPSRGEDLPGVTVNQHEAVVGIGPPERIEPVHDALARTGIPLTRCPAGIFDETGAGAEDQRITTSLGQPRFDLARLQVGDGAQIGKGLLLETRGFQVKDTHADQRHA
jgi:hypothetical protein